MRRSFDSELKNKSIRLNLQILYNTTRTVCINLNFQKKKSEV